ncbi:hypothetical protein [Cryobacterium sp. M25]|uniref:hypothetical protein n=1 Tax=Cryobacterium sp. M25 TaxID=2048293 RepID=UPI000CE3C9CE|nr:hypothetical protein [Cryobacterium sp. M25]
MVRLLIRTAIFIGLGAVGLWVASLVLEGFTLTRQGFLVTVLVFAAAQSILEPVITKLTARNALAFLGGVGLESTRSPSV